MKTLLALTLLLLGVLGCSKKSDPTPAPTTAAGTGSYKYNGVLVNCQVRAYLASSGQGSQATDELHLILVDTPQQQNSTQTLSIEFDKLTGQPTSAYRLNDMIYSQGSGGTPVTHVYSMTGLKETNSGVFSGTFSATLSDTHGVQSTITDGVFTDARL